MGSHGTCQNYRTQNYQKSPQFVSPALPLFKYYSFSTASARSIPPFTRLRLA